MFSDNCLQGHLMLFNKGGKSYKRYIQRVNETATVYIILYRGPYKPTSQVSSWVCTPARPSVSGCSKAGKPL